MNDLNQFELENSGDFYSIISRPRYPSAVINDFFNNSIVLHVIKNYFKVYEDDLSPLYLGIQGPKGMGKTYQTIESCTRQGYVVVLASGTELSGGYEGDSVKKARQLYEFALKTLESTNGRPVVIVIDDFHLSNVSLYSDVKATINSQLLTGFLMNLHDNHLIIDSTAKRIPIILIGNDFTQVHSPLTRHGRMNIKTWNPVNETKIEILYNILNQIGDFSKSEVKSFHNSYNDQSIAFFSSLRQDYLDALILSYVHEKNKVNPEDIRRYLSSKKNGCSMKKLKELAENRIQSVPSEFESLKN